MKTQPNILICFEPMESSQYLPAIETPFDPASDMIQRVYDLEQKLTYTQRDLQTIEGVLEAANERLK